MGDRVDDPAADAGDLHRAAFEEAAVGLAIVSPAENRILDANRHLCRLLGYEPGHLTGLPLSELVARPFTSEGLQSWRGADGRAVEVRVTRSGAAGRTLVVEALDPDEAVRAEQNREALTAAGLGEWRWDAGSGRITLSRRAAQILGHPPGPSLTWRALRAGLSEAERARIGGLVRDGLAQGRASFFESRIVRSDGREVIVGVRGQPLAGPEGELSGMVGVVQDITTRVEARDALLGREQRLRVATSLARLGIFEWHMLDDQAIWENERMFEIFGRTPEDGSVGKTEFLNEVLHPDDRKPVRGAISAALREEGILHVSGRIRRKSDGAWRTIEMAGRFERDAPNRLPRRLIGVVADVTDRRLAEERQSLLIRELHHRVKNTLATVQAIVGSTARTASSIESFYEAFVGRIMSLAHTHSVLTEDTWQTASLRSLLVNELKPYAEGPMDGGADGRVTLEGPPVDLASEIAVPIGMAIHELTTNAAKYGALSTRGGRVAVSWSVQPGGRAGILHFAWRESGGPPVEPPRRQGFGSRLLQRVLTTQVQAEVTTDYAPEGFSLTMLAPLPPRNEALNPLV
ncbi:HWE histidine kinase domain-containing protein [Methylobacterium durans]|uniref:sensor histidine kinase n=1 Tax=Methylobacterium durans TaxID=2202825 RepID=UPI002AFED900|nr:HWE histidine kinase domain-containing protein [Methylobacterium durans]MEA1831443.1 HWE histidine kinase domain-containing protein [Methylobacterium durans]